MKNEGLLAEIRGWKLDAREEQTQRYFFELDAVRDLEDGTVSYVIGRKGTGKTAIAEHINRKSEPTVFTTMLSFKSFPFNSIYAHTDDSFTRPNQYTTLWKHVLYCAVCNMMGRNEAIPAAQDIREIFDLDLETALGQSIATITERSFNFTVLGTGAGTGSRTQVVPRPAPWQLRTDALERFVIENIDGATYYIILDELDEDYRLAFDPGKGSDYFDLITGLFKAVQHIRRRFQLEGYKIYPLVFLRDDIFNRIRDPDKNKWSDASVELEWDDPRIKGLIRHRISRALSEEAALLPFQKVWGTLFASMAIQYGYGGRSTRSVYKHVKRNTLMRPRDFICYIRECARQAHRNRHDRAHKKDIKRADKAYSEYFRQEFVDELHSALPQIDDVFDVLSSIRKINLSIDEFKRTYFKHFQDTTSRPNVDDVLHLLFDFSIIGNLPRQTNKEIFKYQNRHANFNEHEKICVHRGLLKSLTIY